MSVGTSPPRSDGAAKVNGEARYIDDVAFPDMLHGATVRSKNAHAKYRGYKLDPAFDWSDIVFVDHRDIRGPNEINLIELDQPCLVERIIRHPEEPVILLAAPTRERVLAAREHVELLEEPLPAVFDMEEAATSEVKVCSDGNVLSRLTIRKGTGEGCVDRALAADPGARLFEGEYRTGWQEQMYIEPQGVIAQPWGKRGLSIHGSLQCPYYVVKALKHLFKLREDQVRVVQAVTGGGFGGKEEYPNILSCHAGLLALKTGRPVKIVYTRDEDLAATTRRHPCITRHRTAVAEDGTWLAVEVDVRLDGGAYATLRKVVLSRAIIHAIGPYKCLNVAIDGVVLATNTPPNGAFRGFGAPQVCFAVERHLDAIAAARGFDPAGYRRQLAMRVGDTTATNQLLVGSVSADEVLDKALEMADWENRRAECERINAAGGAPPQKPRPAIGDTPRLRGLGMSFFIHGGGFTGNGEARIQGEVKMVVHPDGEILILSGSTDIGQGQRTTHALIAADVFGLPLHRVRMEWPDTSLVPDSGPTVASRTCMVVGKVIEDCAEALLARVMGAGTPRSPGEEAWNAAVQRFLADGGEASVQLKYQTDPNTQWNPDTYEGEAYPCYSWACDVVEVEVEPDTMEVTISGFWAAMDVGKAIHPIIAIGQLEGGTLQGLGFAVLEELKLKDGKLLNQRMTNCIIPTSLDAPELNIFMVEEAFPGGPSGAKGIGELPMDGPAPAVLAAIEHATGIRLESLPASPERLMTAANRRAQ
jgi:CO/xanthine dehydrogenase Mo-binding subunit